MTRLLIALLALAPLAACSSDDADDASRLGTEAETTEDGFGGPIQGQVLETATSVGGEVEIGVTREVVYLRLSDSARAEAQKEMEAEVPEDGIGATIGRMATGFAQRALASTIQIPLADVEVMRYADGHLVIEGGGGGPDVSFTEDNQGGIDMTEADAQRLIEAFESAR